MGCTPGSEQLIRRRRLTNAKVRTEDSHVAAAEFDIPEIKDDIEVPRLHEGVMSHVKSFPAPKSVQDFMGYPHELGEDWKERAIDKMGDLLGKYRSLKVFLDACVHCGACTDKCHYYLGTSEFLVVWYCYFHECAECRRCSVDCPYGIDRAEISLAGRELLIHVGMGQK